MIGRKYSIRLKRGSERFCDFVRSETSFKRRWNGTSRTPLDHNLRKQKMEMYRLPLNGTRGRAYQEEEEEDAFLVCMMHRHGYGAAERIRMEIRRAWQFRFDWYFKSRSAQEMQKRRDAIVKFVEKENEEYRKTKCKVPSGQAGVVEPNPPPRSGHGADEYARIVS
jgi:hypothetical protein